MTEPLPGPTPRDTIAKLCYWHDEKGSQRDFLGTCFALFSSQHFITAAHCLKACTTEQLRVEATFDGVHQVARVQWVEKHSDGDLAVLRVTTSPWASATPFVDVRHEPLLGEPFYAFGYPLDVFSEEPENETDRLFRGHLQRLFHYKSRMATCILRLS